LTGMYMLGIKIICVGKLKEDYFIRAQDEYIKRLGAFCRPEIVEIPENRLPASPSKAQIEDALGREAEAILSKIQRSDCVISLCVEGPAATSEEFAGILQAEAVSGSSKIVFLIGGSHGLSEKVKQASGRRLSLSKMTLPHHLARIVLLEQVYRAFMILSGGKYHK
jgi:23S rRNA (pseudouridine1915-N3)-methyltransferase